MKIILFIFLLFCHQWISAQIFDTETIKKSGDNDKRINLVILSEGYKSNELSKFKTDAVNFVNAMFGQSPFSEYANYFNVHIIKVPSNESGVDHPGTGDPTDESNNPIPTATVDTYFNATFDSYGIHRLLYYGIDGTSAGNTEVKIQTVLANNFPTYDYCMLIVNTPYYGGSGGQFAIIYNGQYLSEVGLHELGHSMFDLKDEYYPGEDYLAEAINMTQESNMSLVKWKNWINSNGIGIFPYGTSGVAATWYRPHQNCKMRYLGVPFCSVCKEGMIEKIHALIYPIDAYTPVSNEINDPTYPIDFSLNLIKPIPNTLESKWVLNSIDFASNIDNISILETDLNSGSNTLTAIVNDNSAFIRVDNHNNLHVYTVTWTIDNSALGIDNIKSTVNNFNISIYPNPSNSFISIKTENDLDYNLKVKMLTMEGKRVKSISLSNLETKQIDISNLSKGIYILNFYSNDILIASKKIIKN